MTPEKIKSVIEFVLLTAGEPLGMTNFKHLLDDDVEVSDIRAALMVLESDWEGRAMQLVKVADGYQFVSRSSYVDYLRRLRPLQNARLSRPLLEVLAVIVYQQPVTRGDVEKIRGVAVSSAQIAALEEWGWIEEVGRRETPGRPILYGTTKILLNDLGVASLDDLPQLSQEDINTADFSGDKIPIENSQLVGGIVPSENNDNMPTVSGNFSDDTIKQ